MSNGHNLEHLASEIKTLKDKEVEYGLTRPEYEQLRYLKRQYHHLDHKQRIERYRVKLRREE